MRDYQNFLKPSTYKPTQINEGLPELFEAINLQTSEDFHKKFVQTFIFCEV